MAEAFEGYSDTFEAVSNAYGMVINFSLSPPDMRSDKTMVARIRMSQEMGKVLAYMLVAHIKRTESDRGVSYPIPIDILNHLKIPKEDWDAFWSSTKLDFGEK